MHVAIAVAQTACCLWGRECAFVSSSAYGDAGKSYVGRMPKCMYARVIYTNRGVGVDD